MQWNKKPHTKKTCSIVKLVFGMLAFMLVAHILFNKRKTNKEVHDACEQNALVPQPPVSRS